MHVFLENAKCLSVAIAATTACLDISLDLAKCLDPLFTALVFIELSYKLHVSMHN